MPRTIKERRKISLLPDIYSDTLDTDISVDVPVRPMDAKGLKAEIVVYIAYNILVLVYWYIHNVLRVTFASTQVFRRNSLAGPRLFLLRLLIRLGLHSVARAVPMLHPEVRTTLD